MRRACFNLANPSFKREFMRQWEVKNKGKCAKTTRGGLKTDSGVWEREVWSQTGCCHASFSCVACCQWLCDSLYKINEKKIHPIRRISTCHRPSSVKIQPPVRDVCSIDASWFDSESLSSYLKRQTPWLQCCSDNLNSFNTVTTQSWAHSSNSTSTSRKVESPIWIWFWEDGYRGLVRFIIVVLSSHLFNLNKRPSPSHHKFHNTIITIPSTYPCQPCNWEPI